MSRTRINLNDINTIPGIPNLGPIPSVAPKATFNEHLTDSLIETKGFVFYHYKHALLPNRKDANSPSNPNLGDTIRGLKYYDPRPIYAVPQSFSMEERMVAQGVIQMGSVLINSASRYNDKRPGSDNTAHINQRDLIVFPTQTDLTRELIDFNPTGPMRLKFRAKGVDKLFDDEFEYVCGNHFDINEDGLIYWIDGARKPDIGAVLSVVYWYTPIYVVNRMLHNIRIIPSNDSGLSPDAHAKYFPQQFTIVQSNIHEGFQDLTDAILPSFPVYPDSKNTTGGSL